MLDYSCGPAKTGADCMQTVMDSLGDSYQTRGAAMSAIMSPIQSALDSAMLALAASQAAITDPILKSLSDGGKCIRDCKQSVAVSLYGAAGQALSNASQCRCNCDSQVPSTTPTVTLAPTTSQPSPTSATTIPTITLSPQPKTADQQALDLAIAQSVCPPPVVLPIAADPTKMQPPHKWCKWCDSRDGDSLILEEPWFPVGDSWKKIACADSKSGPWPDCSKPVPPPVVKVEEPYNPSYYFNRTSGGNVLIVNLPDASPPKDDTPTIYIPSTPPRAFKAPTGCDILFYTGPVKGNIADELALTKNAFDRIFTNWNPFQWLANSLSGAADLALAFNSAYGCPNDDAKYLGELRSYYRAVGKFTGMESEAVDTRITYDINRLCPYRMPSASDALGYYLSGAIRNEQELKEYVAINGHCWEPWKGHIQVNRRKIGVSEAIDLYTRGYWSISQLYENHRQQGYLSTKESDLILALADNIPGDSAVLNGVARQVENPALVAKYRLGGTDSSGIGQTARKWNKWNYTGDDEFDFQWKAHWRFPGFGEMTRLYHLLRTDDTPAEKRITPDDIKETLGFESSNEWWAEKQLDALYSPISRWDIKPAYAVGALTKERMKVQLQRLGFSDADCDTMIDHAEREKNAAILSSKPITQFRAEYVNRDECLKALKDYGYDDNIAIEAVNQVGNNFRNHTAIGDYKDGTITFDACTRILQDFGLPQDTIDRLIDGIVPTLRFSVALKKLAAMTIDGDTAKQGLKDEGMNPHMADKIIDETVAQMDADMSKRCVHGIRNRFLGGELDVPAAANELQKNGIDAAWARKLATTWDCEKSAIGKQLPATSLCGYYEQSLINADEFSERLENVGYKPDTAKLIVGQCTMKIAAKHDEAIAKQIAERQRQIDKAMRNAEADQAKTERAKARAIKASQASRKAQTMRQANLIKLGVEYAKKTKQDGETASREVIGVFAWLTEEMKLSQDAALKIVAQAIDLASDMSPDSIATLAATLYRDTLAVTTPG